MDIRKTFGIALLIGGGIGTTIQSIRLGKLKKKSKELDKKIKELNIRIDEDKNIAKILGIDIFNPFGEEA